MADINKIAYTIDGTADAFGRGRTWVYDRINDGTFRAIEIGGRKMITAAEIRRVLAEAPRVQPKAKSVGGAS